MLMMFAGPLTQSKSSHFSKTLNGEETNDDVGMLNHKDELKGALKGIKDS
jgi:hypothetical protein